MNNIQVAPSRHTSQREPTTFSKWKKLFWKKLKKTKKNSIYTNYRVVLEIPHSPAETTVGEKEYFELS